MPGPYPRRERGGCKDALGANVTIGADGRDIAVVLYLCDREKYVYDFQMSSLFDTKLCKNGVISVDELSYSRSERGIVVYSRIFSAK